ncbi:MAG: hypothetical protein IPO08_21510 [Xanthomonadales bacterium]|nr:hypothetical protein [Xanthomonadales bacterium]
MALSSTCIWASLNEVKPWLRLEPTDVQHDVVLEQLANSVTEELEGMAQRVFVSRAITETFDSRAHVGADRGCAVRRFTLRGYPITSSPLTTFTIDGVAVDADDYVLDAAAGVVHLLTTYSAETGLWDVVLGYTAGFSRATLPARVLQLGAEMLAFRYQDWSAGANAVQSMRMGGAEYIPRSSWPYHIKDAVDALRLEVRGPVFA